MNIKENVHAYSAEECSCICVNTAGCVAWTWAYGEGKMYCGLKGSCAEGKQCDNYVSGRIRC